MPDLLFNPELTDDRLERAAHVYAVTGPGWFLVALIEELRRFRQAYAERESQILSLQSAVGALLPWVTETLARAEWAEGERLPDDRKVMQANEAVVTLGMLRRFRTVMEEENGDQQRG